MFQQYYLVYLGSSSDMFAKDHPFYVLENMPYRYSIESSGARGSVLRVVFSRPPLRTPDASRSSLYPMSRPKTTSTMMHCTGTFRYGSVELNEFLNPNGVPDSDSATVCEGGC